ncbi:hypothetical protein BaRGS_00023722, partial [Batillaria attramentaria]
LSKATEALIGRYKGAVYNTQKPGEVTAGKLLTWRGASVEELNCESDRAVHHQNNIVTDLGDHALA